MDEPTSQQSSKPWGGRLESARDYADTAPGRFDTISWAGLLLGKGGELALMAALLAVPLMYQFDLPSRLQFGLQEFMGDGPFFNYQVMSWIGAMMPILESKFGAWAVLGTLMICFFIAARLCEWISGRRFFASPAGVEPDSSRRMPHRFIPLVCMGVFLGMGLLSIVFWAPEIPPEARVLMGEGQEGSSGALGSLGGGGFLFSTMAWMQVAFALLFFLVAEDLIRRRQFVVKLLAVVVMAGAFNALWVLLIKLETPILSSIWVRFDESDHRNAYGGFIGHNTGLSSYLMPAMLIALTWVFGISPRRNRTLRVVCSVGILLMALVLLIAQSRAVIPILVVVIPLLFFTLARRSCLLYGTRMYVWFPVGIFFLLLTQLIDSQYNPFFRRDITLEERVGQLTPTHLTTETRLRILWVSMTELVPESPLIGHGFGTFQYVYPEAQGKFYSRHPASRIGPTSARTMRAHNEYLQLLIEMGLVGLLVGATGLYFLLRGGWQVLQRTLMPHHIATQVAVFCSLLGLLIHCAMDFPLRIPPTAITIVVFLAIISAGDRLWLFPLKAPQPETDEESESHDPPTDDAGLGLPEVQPRPRKLMPRKYMPWAMGASGVIVFVTGVGVLAFLWVPFQSMRVLTNRGQSILELAQDGGSRSFAYIDAAQTDLRLARRHFWINGPASRLHGQAQFLRARQTFIEADNEPEPAFAAQIRALGITFANHGINDINQTLSEEKFHALYRVRASLHSLVARNHPDPDTRRRSSSQEMEDLFRSAAMNPGDPDTLMILIQMLEQDSTRNRSFLIDYIRTLSHFHPGYFHATVYTHALDAMAMAEFELGFSRLDILREAVPHDLGLRHSWASASIETGRIDEARRVLIGIQEEIDARLARGIRDQQEVGRLRTLREYTSLSMINADIRARNDMSALREIARADDFESAPEALLVAWRLYLKMRSEPESSDIPALRERLVTLSRQDPIALQIAATTAAYTFGLYEEAEGWMRRREGIADPPMDLAAHVVLARALERQGRLRDALDVFGPWDAATGRHPDIDGMIGTSYTRFLAQRYAAGVRREWVGRGNSNGGRPETP